MADLAVADRREAPPWHSLEVDEVVDRLQVDPEQGLSEEEAARRLEAHGPNELARDEPPGDLRILLHQFTSPLIFILLAAGVVTVAIGEYIDTGVIAAVLVLNAVIGFVQERQADRSVRALMELAAPKTAVLRRGRQHDIDSRALVPGDVVDLESGARVAADLRLVRSVALQVDESLLTGESLPVSKRTAALGSDRLAADRTNMAFMGSVVAAGRARGVVVATGGTTELGRIADAIREVEEPETPLQARMNRFANVIALAVAGSSLAAFLIGLAVGEAPGEMFMTAVALAVAIVPEGLPVAFTVAMALGVRRMARRNALIRSLPAVETLGSTNTIGSDKTGTLTQNRMTVRRIWTAGGTHILDQEPSGEDAPLVSPDVLAAQRALRQTLQVGALTNEAELGDSADGTASRGDPTELALLVAAVRAGLDPGELRQRHRVVAEMPFEPDLRYSASVREIDGGHLLVVKGAPERVLGMCTRMAGSGDEVPLDPGLVLEEAERLAAGGLRVLAMASRRVERVDGDEVPEPSDLTLCGLQGMHDPPRKGVREAIARCQAAGIRVVMITGDHAATARAIAGDLGISDRAAGAVLTGEELERLSHDELRSRVLEIDVYARVSPQHKHRIVTALRSHGEVTAVTGDGVNDGPALKAADIGIAMGRSGTDVAREASDMVLTDDNFVSIANAVEEGRIVFDNVRKVTFFLVSTGVAAIAAILYALVARWPLPFLPAQLLWLNVVTNGLQDVALAFEPGERGVLRRPPRPRDAPLVSRLLWERTLFTGVTMAVGSLLLFRWSLAGTGSLEHARSVALTTMVVFMAFHVYNARSERSSLLRMSPWTNPFLLAATLGALAIHLGALHWGPTQFVLRLEPLPAGTWLRLVAVAASVVLVSELHKLLRRG